MITPRQEELEARIKEAQAEFEEIEEAKSTPQFEDMTDGCAECEARLAEIPSEDRKVVSVLVRKGNADGGGLLYFSNGASGMEVTEHGISTLKATMEALKDDEGARLLFQLRLAMFMKDTIGKM